MSKFSSLWERVTAALGSDSAYLLNELVEVGGGLSLRADGEALDAAEHPEAHVERSRALGGVAVGLPVDVAGLRHVLLVNEARSALGAGAPFAGLDVLIGEAQCALVEGLNIKNLPFDAI